MISNNTNTNTNNNNNNNNDMLFRMAESYIIVVTVNNNIIPFLEVTKVICGT